MGSYRSARSGRRDYCVGSPSRGHFMKRGVSVLALACWASTAQAQAVGGADKARPVTGDPGISSMLVMDRPEFRVLRDYAEPGATRRMHSHDDATYHVFTLVTGQLRLTIEGEPPQDVAQGQVLTLKGGAKHTFTNTGKVTATIVEVFGKRPPSLPATSVPAEGDGGSQGGRRSPGGTE